MDKQPLTADEAIARVNNPVLSFTRTHARLLVAEIERLRAAPAPLPASVEQTLQNWIEHGKRVEAGQVPRTNGYLRLIEEMADSVRNATGLSNTLEDKLAMMIWYLDARRSDRISDDARAFNSFLDDAEIMNWLDRMKKSNRIVNTRFTDKGR